MRILMVLDSLRVGGAERHVVDLSLALRRRGHEVTIACSVGGPFEEHVRGEVPVRVLLREEIKRRVSPTYAWRLRRVVAEGFDVVHAHMFASAVAAAATGRPLVITEHSEARWQRKRDRFMNAWACRRAGAVIAVSEPIGRRVHEFGISGDRLHILPNAVPSAAVGAGSCRARPPLPTTMFPITEPVVGAACIRPLTWPHHNVSDPGHSSVGTVAPSLSALGDVSGDPNRVIGRRGRMQYAPTKIIRMGRFVFRQMLGASAGRPYDRSGEWKRSDMEASEGGQRRSYSPYAWSSHASRGGGHGKSRPLPCLNADSSYAAVGVIARLVPEKGVEYVLDCFPDVVRAVPEARLLIVGDGPLRDALEARVRANGPAGRVVFTGSIDARTLLPTISVLAVPSLSEGTPLAMLEAMAAGIPVVATAVGGIPDYLQHGVEGLLVAPGDAAAIGGALIRLLRNGDEARRMGEAGRWRAAQTTHEAMVSRVERIYDAVVAGRREQVVETAVVPAR